MQAAEERSPTSDLELASAFPAFLLASRSDGLCSFFRFRYLQKKDMLSGRDLERAPLLCLPPPPTTGASRGLENPGWGRKEAEIGL